MITAQKANPPGSIDDLAKYSESLYELVACRSEKIGRIVQSDVVLDRQQESDKVDQSLVVITAPGPKKKNLKDLQANGEDEGARSEQEEEDAESTEGLSGNQTGASEKNAANLKMTAEFLAIGRGYDWIESNLDLATPPVLTVLG